MALHQLTSFTLGVPNAGETGAYYREFGLADQGDGNWGPPPPPSFLQPDDLADLMAGSHSG
jgi:hypothetical protein